MERNKLAIIVPAYKINFLSETFQSISSQTCLDFNLYVFDDASPYDIRGLYERFFCKWKNASFFRFSQNKGGENLAEQWNRCFYHIGDEEWVWLFSDDDVMDKCCVENFHQTLNSANNKIQDVLHFDIVQIDGTGCITRVMNPYPPDITAAQYFAGLHLGLFDTRMPEFIFRKEKLSQINGFVSFDLAWKSDNATVTAMTYPGTIHTIPDAKVYWRLSNQNVTGSFIDYMGEERKRLSTIQYFNWTYLFFKEKEEWCGLNNTQLYRAYCCCLNRNDKHILHSVVELSHQFLEIDSWVKRLHFWKAWLLFEFKGQKITYSFKRFWYIFFHM